MESRHQIIEQARQALENEEIKRARALALRAADCELDGSQADRDVVELLIAVDAEDRAVSLARRIYVRSDSVTDAIHMALVLTETGDIDSALAELHKALPRASAEDSRAIGEHLLAAAMAQEDMDAVHEAARGTLPIADRASRDWVMAAGQRALELHTAGELYMEPRRYGYVFGGHVVLGGEECAGDQVEDYWFYTHDVYAAAWMLRRLARLASALGWSFEDIVAGDAACEPIPLAAAQILGERRGPRRDGAALHIIGPQTADALPAAGSSNVVLALGYDGDWYRLSNGHHIDIVGIPAGGELDWGEDERSPHDIADELIATFGELPPDPAMDDMIAFYRRHRQRTPAMERLEQA